MPYAKAIAALVAPIIASVLLPLGISGDTTVENAISILLMAVITAASVYFVPNKK